MFKRFGRWLKSLPQRYRDIPKQIHARNSKVRSKAQKLIAGTICIPLMIVCALYMIDWEVDKTRVEQENEAYSALYNPASAAPSPSNVPSAAPLTEPTAEPAVQATAVPTAEPSAEPTAAPTALPTAVPSIEPSAIPTAEPSEIPSSEPAVKTSVSPESTMEIITAAVSPRPTFEPAVDATRRPAPIPDPDAIVYAIETPPPVQESFAALLELNPETVGFLTIDEVITLPVVQKENDNDYYLTHSFDGRKSQAGALFMDGSNLLVPEDAALIIYGHNMRNGTMFQKLINYEDTAFLKKHPLVQFDTIYENRTYVPFAALTATLEPYSERYLDVRQFSFSQSSFEDYIERIRELSLYESPVDVVYGDSVLMLVTCEYLHDNGRFIVALREVRPDETRQEAIRLVRQTKLKYGK